MKSVVGTIIIFIGLYIILTNDVVNFLAQKSVFYFSAGLAAFMLILAFIVLGIPHKKKGEKNDSKNNHLN